MEELDRAVFDSSAPFPSWVLIEWMGTMTSKKPPSRGGFQKARLPHRMKRAVINYRHSVATRVGEWQGSWEYFWVKAEYYFWRFYRWLATPPSIPKSVWLALLAFVVVVLVLLLAPRPVIYRVTTPNFAAVVLAKEEGGELEEMVWIPYGCSCTSYLHQIYPQTADMGDARNWAYEAELRGWVVDKVPVVGAIGVMYRGGVLFNGEDLGHVVLITEVRSGEVKYQDYNSPLGGFGTCVVGVSDWVSSGMFDWYIHIK